MAKATSIATRRNIRNVSGVSNWNTPGINMADVHEDLAGFLPMINQFVAQFPVQQMSTGLVNAGIGTQPNLAHLVIAWTGYLLSQGYLSVPTRSRRTA